VACTYGLRRANLPGTMCRKEGKAMKDIRWHVVAGLVILALWSGLGCDVKRPTVQDSPPMASPTPKDELPPPPPVQ